jgi:thiol-disulfide isomerase/thioredoxin
MARVALRRLGGLVVALILVGTSCGGPPPEGGSSALLPDDPMALPEFGVDRYRALLQELRGTPVVVNFWGSWCPPCRGEAPDLSRLAREFEGRAQFLGVNFRDSRASARDFIREFDLPFPSVFDPDYEILPALGYVGWPVTLVYDARGTITYERVGAIDPAVLEDEIRGVL